jgi:hypothetical protein
MTETLREPLIASPTKRLITGLEFGELLMRLSGGGQAADHTQHAAQLASNSEKSELARRQATTLRTMKEMGLSAEAAGIFPESEVAVMVAVVLLTTRQVCPSGNFRGRRLD